MIISSTMCTRMNTSHYTRISKQTLSTVYAIDVFFLSEGEKEKNLWNFFFLNGQFFCNYKANLTPNVIFLLKKKKKKKKGGHGIQNTKKYR